MEDSLEEAQSQEDHPPPPSQQLSQSIEPDMMTIIPYWAWWEIQLEKRNWSAAKIIAVYSKNVIVQRYGNETGNYLHPQKPGYVYRNTRKQLRIKYTKQPNKLGTHIPYSNSMECKELDHHYVYNIKKKDLLFTGYTLINDDRIPQFVLDLIETDEWINSGIHVDPNIPNKEQRRQQT
jgi:hypothetical protein